jgi:hypothetical protein
MLTSSDKFPLSDTRDSVGIISREVIIIKNSNSAKVKMQTAKVLYLVDKNLCLAKSEGVKSY